MALDLGAGNIEVYNPLGEAFPFIPEGSNTSPGVEEVHDACNELKDMLRETSETTVRFLEVLRDQMHAGEITSSEALEAAQEFLGEAHPLMGSLADDINNLGRALEEIGQPRGPCKAPEIPLQ